MTLVSKSRQGGFGQCLVAKGTWPVSNPKAFDSAFGELCGRQNEDLLLPVYLQEVESQEYLWRVKDATYGVQFNFLMSKGSDQTDGESMFRLPFQVGLVI